MLKIVSVENEVYKGSGCCKTRWNR